MKNIFYVLATVLILVSCDREGEYAGIPDGNTNKGGILYTINIDELVPGTPLEDFHVFIFDSLNNAILHEYFPTPLHLGREMLLMNDGEYSSVVILNVEETFLYTDYDQAGTKNQRNDLDLTLSELIALLYKQEVKYPNMCSGLEEFQVIKEEKARPIFSMKNGINGFKEILILPDNVNVPWEGGSFKLPILVNMEISKVDIKYADKEVKDWITKIDSESTKSVEELVLNFNAAINISDKRDAFIIITSGDNVDSIKVEQSKSTAQISLVIGNPRRHFIESHDITPITVVFTSPTNWKVEFTEDTPKTWTLSKIRGTNGSAESFIITPVENILEKDIPAAVNITPEGGPPFLVEIRQYQVPNITFDEITYFLSLKNTKAQELHSTRNFSVEIIEGEEWCEVIGKPTWDEKEGSSSFNVRAADNLGESRTAKLIVTSNKISKEISIFQSNALEFIVGKNVAGSTDQDPIEKTVVVTGDITNLSVQVPNLKSDITLDWNASIIADKDNSSLVGFDPIQLVESSYADASGEEITTEILTPLKIDFNKNKLPHREVTVRYTCPELQQHIDIILNQPVTRGVILAENGKRFVVSDRNLGANVPSLKDDFDADNFNISNNTGNSAFKGDHYSCDEAKLGCEEIGWRLPTKDELNLIHDKLSEVEGVYFLGNSSTASCFFPKSGIGSNTPGTEGHYWSSEKSPQGMNYRWSLKLASEKSMDSNQQSSARLSVRCVHSVAN